MSMFNYSPEMFSGGWATNRQAYESEHVAFIPAAEVMLDLHWSGYYLPDDEQVSDVARTLAWIDSL